MDIDKARVTVRVRLLVKTAIVLVATNSQNTSYTLPNKRPASTRNNNFLYSAGDHSGICSHTAVINNEVSAFCRRYFSAGLL